jgi:putative endonuclease
MSMPFNTRAQGLCGEARVGQYLEKRGFVILARNYAQRYGEIDIIARSGDLVVFVEVKMRTSDDVDPGELVTWSKQQKLILTAKRYIAAHHGDTISYRFDVACVMGSHATADILYFADAFSSEQD